jgi:hypothetical protein
VDAIPFERFRDLARHIFTTRKAELVKTLASSPRIGS